MRNLNQDEEYAIFEWYVNKMIMLLPFYIIAYSFRWLYSKLKLIGSD